MKYILSIIFLLTLAPDIFGQNHHVLFRAGIFYSKQDYNDILTTDISKGLELGLSTRLFIYKKVFIQPELSFVQKGGVWKNPIDDFQIKLNELEFATLLGYEIEIKRISIFPSIGIFAGKILNNKTSGNPFANFNYVEFIDEDFEWGGICSGGVGIQISKGKLFLEYRYRFSKNYFRSIDRGSSPDNTLPNIKIKNKGWGLNIGYAFPF